MGGDMCYEVRFHNLVRVRDGEACPARVGVGADGMLWLDPEELGIRPEEVAHMADFLGSFAFAPASWSAPVLWRFPFKSRRLTVAVGTLRILFRPSSLSPVSRRGAYLLHRENSAILE